MIHQLKGEWETRDAKLIPYQTRIKELVKQFDEITFELIPCEDNQLADALATLSSMFKLSKDKDMPLIRIQHHDQPTYFHLVEEVSNGKPGYFDIKEYNKSHEYPPNSLENDKRTLRRLAMSFFSKQGCVV
ncbi:uncharacterized protein LOC114371664 [Glycine soja]|uniref:uncharacterized protein n=1 Tax=Glycine max TaxID=3847 RepID=UPI0003DE8667|nr:uncharacterized protein LOC112998185 [Glycine max]XP_028184832.1 uncharacterized protein LOC114371664 [Glycine soja]|eukprot:XP_025980024.1 uncharacterized protein LOC112998185 [Glycine max]